MTKLTSLVATAGIVLALSAPAALANRAGYVYGQSGSQNGTPVESIVSGSNQDHPVVVNGGQAGGVGLNVGTNAMLNSYAAARAQGKTASGFAINLW